MNNNYLFKKDIMEELLRKKFSNPADLNYLFIDLHQILISYQELG